MNEIEGNKIGTPAIIISDTFGKSEEFKRPDHPDFATSSELKAQEFSGVRHNSLTNNLEIWVLGDLRGSMSKDLAESRKELWEELYRDVFGLSDVTQVSR